MSKRDDSPEAVAQVCWPAMDHAVPVTRHRCKLCGRDKLVTEYAPSELVTRWHRTRAGTPYLAAPLQRCRVCLRVVIRARTGVRRPYRTRDHRNEVAL